MCLLLLYNLMSLGLPPTFKPREMHGFTQLNAMFNDNFKMQAVCSASYRT